MPTFRKAEAADVPVLIELVEALYTEDPSPLHPRRNTRGARSRYLQNTPKKAQLC